MIAQRAQGMPIAYLLGNRDFWTLTLHVTADTLIPRPETEQLVELALTRLAAAAPLSVLELGTGSGAIALALASERPHWQITACDNQQAALNVARKSAHLINASFMRLLQIRLIYLNMIHISNKGTCALSLIPHLSAAIVD